MFSIPQIREDGFYLEALDKGLRSERAFLLAMAEMYVQENDCIERFVVGLVW